MRHISNIRKLEQLSDDLRDERIIVQARLDWIDLQHYEICGMIQERIRLLREYDNNADQAKEQ